MPMVSFEDYVFPRLRMMVPDVPRELLLSTARDALEELCQRSQVWRETTPTINVFANLSDYELDVPAYAGIVAVNAVYWDGAPLGYVDINRVKALGEDLTRPAQNRPNGWTSPALQTVRLLPAPDADHADILTAYCSLRPAHDATEFPEWMLRFREGVAAGAAYRLLNMPRTSWYAPPASANAYRHFQDAIDEATGLAMTGFTGVARPVVNINYMPEC